MMVTLPFPLVERLSESGTTALGPAALLAIATASRQPGSKVLYYIILYYNACELYTCDLTKCAIPADLEGDYLYRWKGQHRVGESGGRG